MRSPRASRLIDLDEPAFYDVYSIVHTTNGVKFELTERNSLEQEEVDAVVKAWRDRYGDSAGWQRAQSTMAQATETPEEKRLRISQGRCGVTRISKAARNS